MPNSSCYTHLRDYFRSGWAFLIPYGIAYVLYAGLNLPVNSPENLQIAHPPSDLWPTAAGIVDAPPLLHIYWGLHIIHLLLAGFTLWIWLRSSRLTSQSLELGPLSSTPDASTPGRTIIPSVVTSAKDWGGIRWSLAPWACLALIFYIPGVYLEWPSDPWEHLRRINEWHSLSQVREHSSWFKSSYFLPYSITGHTNGLPQLTWLNLYCTSVCLLLSWQYYRLARAVGLTKRASTLFVILQTLMFGNSIFGFYRYYGLSSTIIAQLGAVVLVRLIIEYSRHVLARSRGNATIPARGSLFLGVPALKAVGRCSIVLILIILSHIQGIPLAGLSVAGVLLWALIEWRRSMIFWLVVACVILGFTTVYWYPRNPGLDHFYRPQGWFNGWYGLNLLSLGSPSYERAIDILGALGVANLAAGVWLLRRNHLVGWLTVTPVVALMMPFVAIPLVDILSSHGQNIIVFHRTLLAIPNGMALCILAGSILKSLTSNVRSTSFAKTRRPSLTHALVVLGVLILVVLPASGPFYNRTYQIWVKPPHDLSMQSIMAFLKRPESERILSEPEARLLGSPSVAFALGATGLGNHIPGIPRLPPTSNAERSRADAIKLREKPENLPPASLLLRTADTFYTPLSFPAYLSQHWRPNAVALESAGTRELSETALSSGYQMEAQGEVIIYIPQAAH